MQEDPPESIDDWEEPEPDRGTLRFCVQCGEEYYDLDHKDSIYWDPPYNHSSGSSTHCLNCWLGCGPEMPIWQSEATKGSLFSAMVDRVDKTSAEGIGAVVLYLRAPYHAAAKLWPESSGYRLIKKDGLIPEGWSFRTDMLIKDGAMNPHELGRAIILLPPEADDVVVEGDRVEFLGPIPF